MSKEENLRAGIAAVKAGDLVQATSLFAQVVKDDPQSERGWLLLGSCCAAPDRREYCYRRVLALNPNNTEAKQQLELILNPEATSLPPFYTPPSPYIEEIEDEPEPIPTIAGDQLEDVREQILGKETLDSPSNSLEDQKENQRKPSKRKLSNTALMVSLILTPTLIVCGLGSVYLFLSGRLGQILSPAPNSQSTPTLALQTEPETPVPTSTLATLPMFPTPKPTVVYESLFEETPCFFYIYADVDVRCGYLTVPEDRTGDPDHTIRLAVTVYHSFSDAPEPDPVIFLQGGPGAEAIELSVDAYYSLVEPFLSERDFIVFDQRGTGLSHPSLRCEELTKTYSQDIHGLIDETTRELVYSNSFYSCQGLMSSQGIKLNAYTTIESAADVRDLLTQLGYQKANLYGASYGTRLAQVIMRDYPEIVRSAILDSVVPVETSLFTKYPDAIDSGLSTLFTNCAIDPECSTAYPNLDTVFWELVNNLNENPVTVKSSGYPNGTITEAVTGTTVMNIILGSIKNSAFISTAPQSIYRFKEGDFSTLIIQQSGLPFAFDGISPGLFISMMCHEHILASTPEELKSAAERQIIKEFAWLPFYGDIETIYQICKTWGADGPSFGENNPTISDIPSLIISGAYDPTTPPMYAKQIAGQLSRNFYFEFPYLGHTPTAADSSGCAMDIVRHFLDDPSIEPDRACVNEAKPVDFVVPYSGDPPLALKTIQAYGISVDVPENWQTLGGGFYFRGNSPFDLTEAGLLRVPLSSGYIENWFSLEAYGYRGLDGPLIPAGQRKANDFTWQLFTSSSYGRPVDIAMTDDGGWSIVVLLFCNQDEHDALYQTVFLPMIDSANQ